MAKWTSLRAGALGLGVGILIGGVGIAQATWQTDTSWIDKGKTISAAKLVMLLTEADNRLVALETPHASRYEQLVGEDCPHQGNSQLTGFTKKWGEDALNPNSGLYTCPVDGLYRVSGGIEFAGTAPASGAYVSLNLNRIASPQNVSAGVITSGRQADPFVRPSGAISTPCKAGEQLFVVVHQENASQLLLKTSGNGDYNYLIFERVGPMP
jgi:hypothetical protein